MYEVIIYNTETKEYIIEKVSTVKEIDDLVNDLHNTYGDVVKIEIKTVEELVETKTHSEKPECPMCSDPEFKGYCELCNSIDVEIEPLSEVSFDEDEWFKE